MPVNEIVSTIKDFSKTEFDEPNVILRMGLGLLSDPEIKNRPEDRAAILYKTAVAQILLGKFEEAFNALADAWQLHEALDDQLGSLQDQVAVGFIYCLSEQLESAFETFISIRDMAGNTGIQFIEVFSLCHLGRICRELGRIDEGLRFLETARKLAEPEDKSFEMAAILCGIGQIELKLGKLEEAGEKIHKAVELSDGQFSIYSFDYLNTLGEYYILSKNYSDASKLLESNLDKCKEKGFLPGEIQACHLLGILYEYTDQLEKAVEYWQLCCEITEEIPIRHYRILSMEKLIHYYKDFGEYEKAMELLEKLRKEDHLSRKQWIQLTITKNDHKMQVNHLFDEMQNWRERSSELERIRKVHEESIEELQTIREIGQQITSTLEPDAIFSMLHQRLSEMMSINSLLIHSYNNEKDNLQLQHAIVKLNQKEAISANIWETPHLDALVVKNNDDLMMNSQSNFPNADFEITAKNKDKLIPHSMLIVRLKIEKRLIGLMSIQSVQENAFRIGHLKTLQAIAVFVAIALINSNDHQKLVIANEKIAHMAAHDPLTGLPNRVQILNLLKYQLHRCRRYNESLAVLFIDLDGFKLINDTQGHNAGDSVLKEVAKRLRLGIRSTDSAGRLAGDEFLVLLTDNCGIDSGRSISEDLRKSLSKEINFEGMPLKITSSIGLAFFPDDGMTAEELVNSADQAMYDAKASGKDQIALFDE